MKILLTGGGTGGHFYPIIAIIQAIREVEKDEHLADVELYYAGDAPYGEDFFYDNQVKFKRVRTGKNRQYRSAKNVTDIFKTFFSIWSCLWYLFRLYPDVIFGKGGAVSFPILLSARILRIPVVIHESDSTPGRTNLWASKFARSIAISYPEAAEHFPSEKTILTGNPLRNEVLQPITEGAKEFLQLEEDVPVITVLGGSQGAQRINEALFGELPTLLQKYQIIHQTGEKNLETVESVAKVSLEESEYRNRYKYYGHLNDLAMRMAAGVSDLIISRAGSTIFEISAWGKPSIIIPIQRSNGNHQVKNAYYYARSGAAIVIEEENLSPKLLLAQIDKLFDDPAKMEAMSESAKAFANTGAARKIAEHLIAVSYHKKGKPEPKEPEQEGKV